MSLIFSILYENSYIIKNVLQNVLTLINRLCIAICLKAWTPKNFCTIRGVYSWHPLRALVIIKLTIFLEIIHHQYISKYTLECTQLNYFFFNFTEEHTLESSSNEIEQRCIRTLRTTTQAGCITIPPII